MTELEEQVLEAELYIARYDLRIIAAKQHGDMDMGDSLDIITERREGYVVLLKKLQTELGQLAES